MAVNLNLAATNKAAQDAYALKMKQKTEGAGAATSTNAQPSVGSTVAPIITKQDYSFIGNVPAPTTNTPITVTPKPSLKETNLANQAVFTAKTQATTPAITDPNVGQNAKYIARENATQTKAQANPFNIPGATQKRVQARNDKLAGVATPKTTTTDALATSLSNPELLTAKESDVDIAKQSTLGILQASDLANKVSDRDRTLAAGKANFDSENATIGLRDDGSIDESRPNSIASRNQAMLKEYETKQNELNTEFESQRRGRVSGQIRQGLAQRGVNISTMAPEAVLALSDSIGAEAFKDIYEVKNQTVNAILNEKKATLGKLNALSEQGRLSKERYNNLVATTASAYDNSVQQIRTKFANDVFGIADKAEARRDSQGTANVSYIAQLKSLPDNVKAYINTKYGDRARGLNTSDFIKLINADPKVIQGIKDVEAGSAASAGVKNALTQSTINKNNAAAQSSVTRANAAVISANRPRSASTTAKGDNAPETTATIQAAYNAFSVNPDARAELKNLGPSPTKGQVKAVINKYQQ